MKKNLLTFILVTISLILLILAFIGPWYNLSMKYSFLGIQTNYNQNLYLDSIEIYGKIGGIDKTQTIFLSDMASQGISKSYIEFFQNTSYLVIIAIILCVLEFLIITTCLFYDDKARILKKFGVISGLFTLCLTIIAVIYFIVGWNNIINMFQGLVNYFFENIGIQNPFNQNLGFWYSSIKNGSSFSIGPGYAWYLMIIAGFFSFLSAITANKN